jgi:hypothetical protein
MNRDPRLERYLTTLESALKPFPVGDRAEIITEIRSHVLSALERDPSANVETILAALGEPEIVANRYLLERGLKPAKPPISPIVRWIVIGFLGTFAMVLLFAGFVIAQFSPIVKVDEKENKVEILGGMIKVDGANERVTINGLVGDGSLTSFKGSEPYEAGRELFVKFNSGSLVVERSHDSEFQFECMGLNSDSSSAGAWNHVSTLDLSSMPNTQCELEVPAGVILHVNGESGSIAFENADFDLDAELSRGKISFEAKRNVPYKFDIKVDSGKADSFESSTDPKARQARLHVGSGRISNDAD